MQNSNQLFGNKFDNGASPEGIICLCQVGRALSRVAIKQNYSHLRPRIIRARLIKIQG